MGGALRDELLGRPVVDVDRLPRAGARGTRVCQGRRGAPFPALRAARSLADRARGWKHRRLHRRCREHQDDLERLHAQRDGPPAEAVRSSIPSTARVTSRGGRSAVSPGVFEPILSACCVQSASKTSSGSTATPRRRGSSAGTPRSCRSLPASGLSASWSGCPRPAIGAWTSSACSRRSAARRSASTGSTSRTRPSTGSCAPSGLGSGSFHLAPARSLRADAAHRRGATRRIAAGDPPLPTQDGAGRSTRSPSSAGPTCGPRSSRHVQRIPAQPLLRGDELGLPPGPRSASCWS